MAEILSEIVHNPAKTVLALHQNPDGDSIGSNLALFRVLQEKGHEVVIYSKDSVSPKFSFLQNIDQIHIIPPSDIPWNEYERFIALDMGGPEMLGEQVKFPPDLEITTVDHHKTNTKWGKKNIVKPHAISTSSVLLEEFNSSQIEIDKQVATALLTGLATDSGFFNFSEDEYPFEHASELIKKGADFQKIVDSILGHIPANDIPFVAQALKNFTLINYSVDKSAAFITVDHKLWENVGVSQDKNVYLLYYLNNLEEAEFGALLVENSPGDIRVQLRTKSKNFDVSKLAANLGGGGHKKSSGAKIKNMTLDEVKAKILASL